LAAGLRPDPLGELKRSHGPDPLAAIWGPTSKGREEGQWEGGGGKRERGVGEREGRKGRGPHFYGS